MKVILLKLKRWISFEHHDNRDSIIQFGFISNYSGSESEICCTSGEALEKAFGAKETDNDMIVVKIL